MVWKSWVLAVCRVVVTVLVLLHATPVDSSFCQMCPTDSQPLLKTKQHIVWIKQAVRKLYMSYLTHMGLLKDAHILCQTTPVPSFPNSNITRKPESVMLQELYRTLLYMEESLALITEQQKRLIGPDEPLHGQLKKALKSVTGLLSNTHCAICLQGLTPADIILPKRSTDLPAIQQKIEGCRVLWSYSEFTGGLAKAFKKQLLRGKRPEGQKKRNRRRQTATF